MVNCNRVFKFCYKIVIFYGGISLSLVESGSVQKQPNEVGPVENMAVEEQILERVEENPEIRVR